MAESEGISGIAVAVAAVGGVLMYAGFQGLNPLEALREITSGKAKPLEATQVTWIHDAANNLIDIPGAGGALGGGAASGIAQASTGGSGPNAAIADAALAYRNDKYSMAKRSQDGYSDCSSFAAKAMRRAGISVPDYNTTAFMRWGQLKKIDKSQIARGDLLINHTHMAIALSSTTAIGQQNSNSNVRTGTFEDIMMYTGPWSAYRYVGSRSMST